MKNNFSFEQSELTTQQSYDKSYEELLGACQQQIELEPSNPDTYIALGDLLRQHPKQLEEALEAYQKAINLTSSHNTSAYRGIKKVIKQAASVATINQPPYEKIILHTAIGGLCNRLRILCSYLCLSYFWDIPLFLCWYPEDACNCYFHELFEPVCATISPQSMVKLFRSENSAKTLYVYLDKNAYIGMNVYERYLKDELERETFGRQYLEFVRKLKPKQHLLQAIDKFRQQHWIDNIIGLHIRRTDLFNHLKYKKLESNFSSDEMFISAIEKEIYNGCSKFFLATDNKITQQLIYHKFPNKIISYCQRFNSDNKRQTPVKNAVIDLYLLSKCQKMIGSYYSSFSEYAAELGGIPLIYP
ncbi:MAG: hypothetical protein F6K10_06230 [Moorea sp. SIO2B7]|nr:hypothetical protein [Moorena sp. SIO2B7]